MTDLMCQIMEDPTASYWLKDAIKALMQRDILDAARDAETLHLVLKDYRDQILSRR
jgi:hypothetical protein